MFDNIIMNIFRKKALEWHVQLVDSYFTNADNNTIYMYRDQFKTFTGRKALMKVLMLYVYI